MDAIETNQLTRSFDSLIAVNQLTLAIPAGIVFGFLGPNGAGKTTTVRMLSALIAPTSGTAVVAGHQLGKDNKLIRRSVGLLTETPGLYDRMSAFDNLVFFGRLYDLRAAQAAKQTERFLRDLDLWERRDEKVGGFSKGMRQKLAIARALLHEPQVVFLDEPTSSLDPEAARTVLNFIKTLRAEGRTIVLTTHNLPEADEMCDVIAIFKTELIRVDTPDHLRVGLFGQGVQVRLTTYAADFVNVVKALPFVKEVAANNSTLSVQVDNPDEQSPALVQALISAGAQIRSVEPISHTLEEVYMQLVGAMKTEGKP
jgi:ABC-2 type transport system ATP-binding protein